jgi:hypothetical protein
MQDVTKAKFHGLRSKRLPIGIARDDCFKPCFARGLCTGFSDR